MELQVTLRPEEIKVIIEAAMRNTFPSRAIVGSEFDVTNNGTVYMKVFLKDVPKGRID